MKKIIFPYGILSGGIVIGSMIFGLSQEGSEDSVMMSQWFGYLIMIVALSVIFLGIKRYRDKDLGGVISFGTACLVGIGIAAVAGVIYVTVWEAHLSMTDHAFIEKYTASVIAGKKAKGLSEAELQTVVEEMEKMKKQYANPLFRLPITFLEIFPVGLLITLISAGLLRNSQFMPAKS